MVADEPKEPQEQAAAPPQPSGGGLRGAERVSRLITFGIKIAGVAMAVNEAFLVSPPRDPVVLGLAAFMMAGAQGVDSIISSLVSSGNNSGGGSKQS